jgi:hypothetical protein
METIGVPRVPNRRREEGISRQVEEVEEAAIGQQEESAINSCCRLRESAREMNPLSHFFAGV